MRNRARFYAPEVVFHIKYNGQLLGLAHNPGIRDVIYSAPKVSPPTTTAVFVASQKDTSNVLGGEVQFEET